MRLYLLEKSPLKQSWRLSSLGRWHALSCHSRLPQMGGGGQFTYPVYGPAGARICRWSTSRPQLSNRRQTESPAKEHATWVLLGLPAVPKDECTAYLLQRQRWDSSWRCLDRHLFPKWAACPTFKVLPVVIPATRRSYTEVVSSSTSLDIVEFFLKMKTLVFVRWRKSRFWILTSKIIPDLCLLDLF